MKPFRAKDYIDGFFLHRSATFIERENESRSFALEEIAALIDDIAGDEALLIGGCALALLERHYGFEVRRVKDIDVVSPPRIAAKILAKPGARVLVRHKTPRLKLKYAYFALQTLGRKRVVLPFTDP